VSARAHSVYVGHMRVAIERAVEFTAGLEYAQFVPDTLVVYATVRALEILDEAAKRVPDDARAMEPSMPWRQMAGMRDVIIHKYDDVDLEEVWKVVKGQIPDFLPRLGALQRRLELREDEEWLRLQAERPIAVPDSNEDEHA